MAIELLIPESTRSSPNSSRIKSYDCLKLTLLFQSRNNFMDFIKDQKRVHDQIKTFSNACKANARVHSSQAHASNHAHISRRMRMRASKHIRADARIPSVRIPGVRNPCRAALVRVSSVHASENAL